MNARTSEFFRRLITKAGKQEALASQLECSSANLTQITKGETIPAPEKLAEWSEPLARVSGIPSPKVFTLLYHYQSYDRLLRMLDKNGHNDQIRHALREYDDILRKLDDDLGASLGGSPGRRRQPKILSNFPDAFENLTIVTGDRRESPPKTAGDIGAFSASPCDDKYLYEMRLPAGTTKTTDKIFVQSDQRALRRLFGRRNLLVIGSPASNHLARIVNKGSIFRFNLEVKAVQDLDQILQEARGKNSHQLQTLQEEQLGFIKFSMRRMFYGGLFDPTYEFFFRAGATSQYRDYGVISLAQNPYSDDARFVCILVGGLHLPGTMQGVNLLSKPEVFKNHPFGGVYEVDIANDTWEQRLERDMVTCNWERHDDPPNEVDAIQKGLSSFKQGASPSREDLDETGLFLEQLIHFNSLTEDDVAPTLAMDPSPTMLEPATD